MFTRKKQHQLDERGLPIGYQFQADWELSPREVNAMQSQGEPMVLIDCRTAKECELVSIAGALQVPMKQTSQHLPDLIAQCEGKQVVVYCHHGVRSLRVAAYLRQEGIERVMSMAGGIDLWALDVEPGMARY